MKYQKICVLDTETTSVYWNSAAPVQIAAIVCDNKGNIIDSFNEKIKTTHKIDPEASKVHGIYAQDLVNCRGEKDVLMDFCEWMAQQEVDVVLTYNGEAFDRPMEIEAEIEKEINILCDKNKIIEDLEENTDYYEETNVNPSKVFDYFNKDKFPGIDGYYDCIAIAKKQNLFGLKDQLGRKWKLTLVADILGFSTENAHDALADVMMLKNIFFKVDPIIHPDKWVTSDDGTVSLF